MFTPTRLKKKINAMLLVMALFSVLIVVNDMTFGPQPYTRLANSFKHKIASRGVKNNDDEPPPGKTTSQRNAQWLLRHYDLNWTPDWSRDLWQVAEDWVNQREIHPDKAPELGAILTHMATAKIIKADVSKVGTQLKMKVWLEGGQVCIFKPKWYERDYLIEGPLVEGGDRHNGEIAAFHLNRLLGFNRSPLAVGRVLNMQREILPVSTKNLSKTFFKEGENSCFYGQCKYCKREHGACGEGEMLEGSLILWLPGPSLVPVRNPFFRPHNGKVPEWDDDDKYCDKLLTEHYYWKMGHHMLDLIDSAVLDFMILNTDRHTLEVFNRQNSTVLLLDNGKSFARPDGDEIGILSALKKCCVIRHQTYIRLHQLHGGVLSNVLTKLLAKDPIAPVLSEAHILALDRRVDIIIDIVKQCIAREGKDNVLIKEP